MFIVEGIYTTIPLHRRILADPDFRAGKIDTTFIEDFWHKAKRRCQRKTRRKTGSGSKNVGPIGRNQRTSALKPRSEPNHAARSELVPFPVSR